MADKVDLYVEQVKLLTEDIALSSSTLKRLVEQSANDPESFKVQVCLFCFHKLQIHEYITIFK